jgi:hypothetical protein
VAGRGEKIKEKGKNERKWLKSHESTKQFIAPVPNLKFLHHGRRIGADCMFSKYFNRNYRNIYGRKDIILFGSTLCLTNISFLSFNRSVLFSPSYALLRVDTVAQ